MTDLPLGLKHYLLILVPNLIEELEDFGVQSAASEPGLEDHEVEKAFFAARSLQNRLPRTPAGAGPDLWPEIMRTVHAIRRVLDVLEKEAFEAVAEEARKATSDIARADLTRVFEQKRAEGEIDFRLHGLTTGEPGAGEQDPAVQEAFLLKRTARYQALAGFDEQSLKEGERVIVKDAKVLACRMMEEGGKDGRIDALLALSAVMIEMAGVETKPGIPDTIKGNFRRMTNKATMAIGAIVYRDEYQHLKASLDLPTLDSDL